MMSKHHISPDLLAAFSEKVLSEEESESVFAHLAECARCRDWVEVHAQLTIPVQPRSAALFLRAALRWRASLLRYGW